MRQLRIAQPCIKPDGKLTGARPVERLVRQTLYAVFEYSFI
jgi:hypothetical protein